MWDLRFLHSDEIDRSTLHEIKNKIQVLSYNKCYFVVTCTKIVNFNEIANKKKFLKGNFSVKEFVLITILAKNEN